MSFCIITKDGSVVGYKNGDNETALLKPVPIELLNSDTKLLKELVDNKNNSAKFVELMNMLQSKSASPQTGQTSSFDDFESFIPRNFVYKLPKITDIRTEIGRQITYFESSTIEGFKDLIISGSNYELGKKGNVAEFISDEIKQNLQVLERTHFDWLKPGNNSLPVKILLQQTQQLIFEDFEKYLSSLGYNKEISKNQLSEIPGQIITNAKNDFKKFQYSLPSNSEVQSSLDTESYSLTPIQQLKYILTDLNIDFNSLSPTTKAEIESLVNSNPSIINSTDFINKIEKGESLEEMDSRFETSPEESVSTIMDVIQDLSSRLGVPFEIDETINTAGKFRDGKVILNPKRMNEKTVWHEFSHPFIQAVRKQNPELYDNLINELYNTTHGQAMLAEVNRLYADKGQTIREEEAIVELIAMYSTGNMPERFKAPKYKGLWQKLKDFIAGIGNMIFSRATDVSKQMNPKWIADAKKGVVPVFGLKPNLTISEMASVLKHGGIIYKYGKDAYRSATILNSDLSKIQRVNEFVVSDFGGVFHSLGAVMNNAGIRTLDAAIDNFIQLLSDNRTIELASWNNRGRDTLKVYDVNLSFKDESPVKASYFDDAATDLEEDSTGYKNRYAGSLAIPLNPLTETNDTSYTESIIAAKRTNIKEIIITQRTKQDVIEKLKELSELTGAPIILNGEVIYQPENIVEYEAEEYDSRFENEGDSQMLNTFFNSTSDRSKFAEKYQELYSTKMNSDLESKLIDYVSELGVTVSKESMESMKAKFGVNALGVFDIINKSIHIVEHEERDILTLPEEVSHAIIELMGTNYKHNPEYSELVKLVTYWEGYNTIYNQYKNQYLRENGEADDRKIKKEAIGKALAMMLIKYYKEGVKTPFLYRVVELFKKLISNLVNSFKTASKPSLKNDQFLAKISKIANAVLNKENLNFNLAKDNPKVKPYGYEETIERQNSLDNGKAVELMKLISEAGGVITGSLAIRKQGTLYRKDIDSLHDIDVAIYSEDLGGGNFSSNEITIGEFESSNYFNTLKDRYGSEMKFWKYWNDDKTKSTTFQYIITSDEIFEKYFSNHMKSLSSTIEELPEELVNQVILLDFFIKPYRYQSVVDEKYGITLSHYSEPFSAKIFEMGRTKDVNDYVNFKRFEDTDSRPIRNNSNYMFNVRPVQTEFTNPSNVITKNDRIIWGHPAIGKTTAKEKFNFLDFDTDFKPLVAELLGLPENEQNSIAINEWRKNNDEELFKQAMRTVWEIAKKEANLQGRRLMVSDMMFLRENEKDFDKIINTPDDIFIQRASRRGDDKESLQGWKNSINRVLSNVTDKSKIIKTSSYLSDLIEDTQTEFTDTRLTPLKSILANAGNEMSIISSPERSLVVDGSINESYLTSNEITLEDLAPLYFNKMMTVESVANRLSELMGVDVRSLSESEAIQMLQDSTDSEVKDFLVQQVVYILRAQGFTDVDQYVTLSWLIGKHNDVTYYKNNNTAESSLDDGDDVYKRPSGVIGSIPLDLQTEAQRKISDNFAKAAEKVTGETIEVPVEEIIKSARNKKERQFLRDALKGQDIATVYMLTGDPNKRFVRKRPSLAQQEIKNKYKTIEEIKNLEEGGKLYRETGTKLHKLKEDSVKIFDSISKDITNSFIGIGAKRVLDKDIESIVNAHFSKITNHPEYKKMLKEYTDKNEGLLSDSYKKFNTSKTDDKRYLNPYNASRKSEKQFEALIKSLLKSYVELYEVQYSIDKEANAGKKDKIWNKPNIFTERVLFDEKEDEAGTLDFVAIYSDGSASILDYKFINARDFEEFDVYEDAAGKKTPTKRFNVEKALQKYFATKDKAYSMQLSRYSQMLTQLYGVTKIRQVRIKPTFLAYTKDKNTGKETDDSKVFEIYTSDETTGLIPIKEEKTGNKSLDLFIDSLIKQVNTLSDMMSKRKLWGTDFLTQQRILDMKKIIMSIQTRGDLSLYTTYVADFIKYHIEELRKDNAYDYEKIRTTLSELEFINYFLNNTSDIMGEFAEIFPKEHAKFESEIGKLLNQLNSVESSLKEISINLLRANAQKLGIDNNIFDSYQNASDIGGFQATVLSMGAVNHPFIQLFKRRVERMNFERINKEQKIVSEITKLQESLSNWGKSKGLRGVDVYKEILDENKNLISEYSKDYWKARSEHADTSIEDNLQWWKDNFELSDVVDLSGKSPKQQLEEAFKKYKDSLDEYIRLSPDLADAQKEETKKTRLKEWEKENDPRHPEFRNYTKNRFITPKNRERFFSEKYKELLKIENKPLRDFYEYLVKKNYEFKEIVKGDFRIDKNFVPNIHKSMMDTFAQDGLDIGNMFKNYMNSIKNSFNDKSAGTVATDEKEIPVLFMDFMQTEDKSIDLAKSFLMFSSFISTYKHARELKHEGEVLKHILAETPMVKTEGGVKQKSKVVAGEFEKESAGMSNVAKLLNDIYNYYVFGESTKKDAVSEFLGEKGVRMVSKIQGMSGRAAMSLNFMSAFVGSINARSQMRSFAEGGKYFTVEQLNKAQLAVAKFDAKVAFVDELFQIGTDETTYAKASRLSANANVRRLAKDPAYVFERFFSNADEKVILHIVLNNYGIDKESGVIMRLEKLKLKYPNEEIKSVWDCIEDITEDGQPGYAIINPYTNKEIELVFDKEMTEAEELENNRNINTNTSVRRIAIELNQRIKGTMTSEDIASRNLSVLGRALGQYRNWIPATFNERMKGEAYNMTMDEYEIGRWRAAWRLGAIGYGKAAGKLFYAMLPFTKSRFDSLGDSPKMREMYDLYIENNPHLKDKVSYQDYVEEHVSKIKSFAKELQLMLMFLLSLQLLKWMWDDEDEKESLLFGALNKTLSRVNGELGFYFPVMALFGYDQLTNFLTKDPIPMLNELKNSVGLVSNTVAEGIDFAGGAESGKTIAPRIWGDKWDWSLDEKQDYQGPLHYTTGYLGLRQAFNYLGLRGDRTTKEDTVWEKFFGSEAVRN